MSWCFLRQATVPILLIPSTALYNHPTWRDGSFCWIWWVALGWAAAIFGIKQGYDGLALYRDVLVNARKTVMTSNQIGRPQNGLILDYGSVAPENPETTPSFTQSIDIKRRPLLVASRTRRLADASSLALLTSCTLCHPIVVCSATMVSTRSPRVLSRHSSRCGLQRVGVNTCAWLVPLSGMLPIG